MTAHDQACNVFRQHWVTRSAGPLWDDRHARHRTVPAWWLHYLRQSLRRRDPQRGLLVGPGSGQAPDDSGITGLLSLYPN